MDTGQDNGTLRVTIKEAAARLGVTDGAIRKRVQRGSIHSEMGDDGRVYVYLDPYQDASNPESQVEHEPLVEAMRDQVAYLREQLAEEREARRRADTIIAQLTQANSALASRVPELEAAEKPRSPVEWAEDEEYKREDADLSTRPQEQRQSWWRRVFGG